jgi:hypothetical protein
MMVCLLRMEFRAKVKGRELSLSNRALEYFGVSRRSKSRGLEELKKRGLITYTQASRRNPKVKLWPQMLK